MTKLTIRLDDDMHTRLRLHSVKTKEPLQQMVVRLLRAELARKDRGAHTTPRRR